MALSSLTLDKQYSDHNILGEARLDAMFDSVSLWANIIRNQMPVRSDNETVSGIWTLGTPKIVGAGTGLATLQYGNSANNRTITFPDPSGSDTVSYLSNIEAYTTKTFTSPTLASPTLSGTVALPSVDPPNANALTTLGTIKAWGKAWGSSPTAIDQVMGYNIGGWYYDSLNRLLVIALNKGMLNTSYVIIVTSIDDGTAEAAYVGAQTNSTFTIGATTHFSGSTSAVPECYFMVFGAQ